MAYNVLQLLESFRAGGSERQSVQLTRLLHESGKFRVRVACLNADGVLREEVDRLGVGEIPAYPLTSFYDRNMAAQLRRFARFLRENTAEGLLDKVVRLVGAGGAPPKEAPQPRRLCGIEAGHVLALAGRLGCRTLAVAGDALGLGRAQPHAKPGRRSRPSRQKNRAPRSTGQPPASEAGRREAG